MNPFLEDIPAIGTCPIIPIPVILASTNHLSLENLFGSGSLGSIFSGVYPDGTLIVVRVIESIKEEEFESLVRSIDRLRHQNIATLMGYGIEKNMKDIRGFLIYEFLQGGTFAERMSGLNWLEKLRVLTDAAVGLSHAASREPPVNHNHLSSRKIMLDQVGTAKVIDLGLYSHVSNDVVSFGEIIRECLSSGSDWPENIFIILNELSKHLSTKSFRQITDQLRNIAIIVPGPVLWEKASSHRDEGTQTEDYPLLRPNDKQCCSLS